MQHSMIKRHVTVNTGISLSFCLTTYFLYLLQMELIGWVHKRIFIAVVHLSCCLTNSVKALKGKTIEFDR